MFNGHGIFEKRTENHTFVCHNTRMIQKNLSVFTKSSFLLWYDYLANKEFIEELLEKGTNQGAFDELIYIAEEDVFPLRVWRNKGRNGEYVTFERINDWKYNNYIFQQVISHPDLSFTSDGLISYLLKLNDIIQEKLTEFPDITSEDWTEQERASYEFFIDVNSSRDRCLIWEKNLKFLKEGIEESETGAAKITQEYEEKPTKFLLYFFGASNTRKVERKVGFRDINIVAPRKDATGAEYIVKDSGTIYFATSQENPNSHTAGVLDVKYTELLNKWESGTPQMIAVMTTDLPSVARPALDEFIDGEAADSLSYTAGLQVLQGSAIPLSMDQCNPLQWCPTYTADERYRKIGDRDKAEVRVFNVSDQASYSAGDIVLLNRIDGVWIPMPFSQGVLIPSKKTLKEWDFTYLMTNSDYFFRNVKNQLITYDDFEQALHKSYYQDDDLNKDVYSNQDDFMQFANIENNFFQVTSWDFMGSGIGGLRPNGHALACTQFGYYPNNENVNGSNEGKESKYISGPFFGCVFPNGYREDEHIESLKSEQKSHNIKPVYAKDSMDNNHKFFQEITSDRNVFNNDTNTNILDSAKDGMFVDNINQLPADIGVNSSPSGFYGRPISLVRTLPSGINNIKSQFKEHFKDREDGYASGVPKRYSWLHENPLPEIRDADRSDLFNSAFHLQPENNRKIQFRPLKTETYACFELQNKYDVDVRSEQRGEFARRMWDSQGDDTNPIAVKAKDRNLLFSENALIAEVDASGKISEEKGLIYENSVKFPRDKGDNNPDLLWDRNWIGVGNNNQGNAFGIIGAACTVNFDNKIQFITDNYIGMQPWFLSSFLYSSWGRGDYNQAHTTDLSVRAFHPWPKDQTIYDSRYFAVHHFNPGVQKQDPLDDKHQAEVDASGKIMDVDFLKVISPEIGAKINKDTTPFESGVSTVRRGKLLPFSFEFNTIGIGPYAEILPDDIPDPDEDPLGAIDPLGKTAQDTNILIVTSGEQYSEDDRFTVIGGHGRNVVLKPILQGDHGGIVNFEVLSSGYNFLKEDFPQKNTPLNAAIYPTLSNMVVVPIDSEQVSGQGMQAIIVGGTVVKSPVFIDQKPKEVFFRKISPNPTTDSGLNQIADVTHEVSVTFGEDISETLRSSNNVYDLFFYFHNDISHTWDWDRDTLPPAYEQKIDLLVNLDPDT